jgi:hypothetical protein
MQPIAEPSERGRIAYLRMEGTKLALISLSGARWRMTELARSRASWRLRAAKWLRQLTKVMMTCPRTGRYVDIPAPEKLSLPFPSL